MVKPVVLTVGAVVEPVVFAVGAVVEPVVLTVGGVVEPVVLMVDVNGMVVETIQHTFYIKKLKWQWDCLIPKLACNGPMTIHCLEMHVLVYIHYFNEATIKIVFYLTCRRTCWASTAKAAIFTYTIRAILNFFTQFSSRCKQRHLKSIFVMDACLFYVVAWRNTTGGAGRTTSRGGGGEYSYICVLSN